MADTDTEMTPPPSYLLGVNAGSSSVKLSLFTTTIDAHGNREPQALIEAEISKLSSPPHTLSIEPVGFRSEDEKFVKKEEVEEEFGGQEEAFRFLVGRLEGVPVGTEGERVEVGRVSHVLHRIVHGGIYKTPQLLTKKTVETLSHLADLAPLHNAASLPIVHACLDSDLFNESTRNIAFFDSSFHTTIPPSGQQYMLDPSLTRDGAIKRYGFHGLSYGSLLSTVSSHLSKPPSDTSLLALHLGSGCSICAIQNGKSIATSMGLTPLEGLPGATRAGSLDPSAVFHMLSTSEKAGQISYRVVKDLGISRAEEVLNKKSGWKAMTGTADFGEVCERAEKGDEKAQLAFEILLRRIIEFVGGYYVLLGGEVDALVFAGGIGEKSSLLRKEVVKKLGCLGFSVDEGMNERAEVDEENRVVEVTNGVAKMNKVLVVRTDEAGRMCEECCMYEEFWDSEE